MATAGPGGGLAMDRRAVRALWEHDRAAFHALLATATVQDLHRRSHGTRWTNQQLLFHMLLGYQIVRALRVLLCLFGWLPTPVSRGFARVLNAATVPFDVANYLGSCVGGLIGPRRMDAWFDRIIAALRRGLDTTSDAALAGGMHYPTRWDPFFGDYMTLAELYRYPAQHFAFHRRQLTLAGAEPVTDHDQREP